ncbi:MAG: LamG-like jellyroll fold domain-containing protein, partial [Planctomycetota bacterium]|nr:LamG-like jellyroll fold domain-containing protein [Planctomycetota bacterium]
MRALLVFLPLTCAAFGQGGRVLHEWTAPDDMPGVATEAIADDRAALVLDGKSRFRVTDDHATVKLPKRSFTVTAWVRVDRPQPWGGIVSCLQDNGAKEAGWLLGVRDTRFCFAVASVGADDGDGLLTYLTAARTFTPGGWHHVV